MRHRVKKTRKLGIDKEHTISMIRNLAINLIIHEKIETTRPRAKAVQPFVEKLIGMAKKSEKLHAIRQLEKALQHENASKKILEEFTKRFADRNSGYTRLMNVGVRKGDSAPLVYLQFV